MHSTPFLRAKHNSSKVSKCPLKIEIEMLRTEVVDRFGSQNSRCNFLN